MMADGAGVGNKILLNISYQNKQNYKYIWKTFYNLIGSNIIMCITSCNNLNNLIGTPGSGLMWQNRFDLNMVFPSGD